MCDCIDRPFGDYDSMVSVVTPQGRPVNIDPCVLPEVRELWEHGIETIESCCGHNKTPGYIAVKQQYESNMETLGYRRDPNAPHVFLPRKSQ